MIITKRFFLRLWLRLTKLRGQLLCRRGHHEMVTIPTGTRRLPWHVHICCRCGKVRDVAYSPYGRVVVGEWESWEDFKENHDDTLC